jgi:AraC-like DNA-binding protein
MQPDTTSRRGILEPGEAARRFSLRRHLPAPDLADRVELHWIVEWDLRGRPPHRQSVLPHPSVNLVVEPEAAAVHGVDTGRFDRELRGAGRAIGTKFRPGGFAGLAPGAVAGLTDRAVPVAELFGADGDALARAVRAADDRAAIRLMEAFVRERLPRPDPNVALVTRIMALLLEEPSITRVDQLAARLHRSPRTLQRLFHRYVGVSPKWVLQRIRLHEAAERMADGRSGDWAALALDLGYADQAHFINDFRSYVGRSPAEYAAACAAAGPQAAAA